MLGDEKTASYTFKAMTMSGTVSELYQYQFQKEQYRRKRRDAIPKLWYPELQVGDHQSAGKLTSC